MYIEWEYTHVGLKRLQGLSELDRLGGQGWECYAVTNDTDGVYQTYHFKRKKFGDNQ